MMFAARTTGIYYSVLCGRIANSKFKHLIGECDHIHCNLDTSRILIGYFEIDFELACVRSRLAQRAMIFESDR